MSVPPSTALRVTDHRLELLHAIAGTDATFRAGQLEAIDAVVPERRRVLLVQRTGWGKSAVYFIATRLLRDAGAGPTILVSPLLALMRNQIRMAERRPQVWRLRATQQNPIKIGAIKESLERHNPRISVDDYRVSEETLQQPLFGSDS